MLKGTLVWADGTEQKVTCTQHCDTIDKIDRLIVDVPVGLADHVEPPLAAGEVVGDDGGAPAAGRHAVGGHAKASLGGAAAFVNLRWNHNGSG